MVSLTVSDSKCLFRQLTNTCFATPPEICSDLGSSDFVEVLLADPTGEEEKYSNLVARFVGLTMAPAYTKQRIKEWCGFNRGKRFLAMISSSYLAYGLVLLKDKANVWEMEYQTQTTLTTVEEQKRYKDFKKSPKSVTL